MYAYCLYCATVKCAAIASAIQRKFGYTAFSPRIVQRKWIKGACFEEEHPYLPGYVFMYSEAPMDRFREIRMIDGVRRCLGDRDDGYCLKGEDKQFADMLYAGGGVIGIMKAYKEGDRVRLSKSIIGDFEAEIVRLDRRKGRALLEYTFDGNSYRMWVGYDLIEDDASMAVKPQGDRPAK